LEILQLELELELLHQRGGRGGRKERARAFFQEIFLKGRLAPGLWVAGLWIVGHHNHNTTTVNRTGEQVTCK